MKKMDFAIVSTTGAEVTAPFTLDLVIQFATMISATDQAVMNARAAHQTHIETKMDFANV